MYRAFAGLCYLPPLLCVLVHKHDGRHDVLLVRLDNATIHNHLVQHEVNRLKIFHNLRQEVHIVNPTTHGEKMHRIQVVKRVTGRLRTSNSH